MQFSSEFTTTSIVGAGGTSMSSQTPSLWGHSLQVTGTGAVSATCVVEGRMQGQTTWTLIVTLTASGTGSTAPTDTQPAVYHVWTELRHRCTAISGTGAKALVISAGD